MKNLLVSEYKIKKIVENMGYIYGSIYRMSENHPYRVLFHLPNRFDGTSLCTIVEGKTKTQIINGIINTVKRHGNKHSEISGTNKKDIELKDSSRIYIEEV